MRSNVKQCRTRVKVVCALQILENFLKKEEEKVEAAYKLPAYRLIERTLYMEFLKIKS